MQQRRTRSDGDVSSVNVRGSAIELFSLEEVVDLEPPLFVLLDEIGHRVVALELGAEADHSGQLTPRQVRRPLQAHRLALGEGKFLRGLVLRLVQLVELRDQNVAAARQKSL